MPKESNFPALPPGYVYTDNHLCREIQTPSGVQLERICLGRFTIGAKFRDPDGSIAYRLVVQSFDGEIVTRNVSASHLHGASKLRSTLAGFELLFRDHKAMRTYLRALVDMWSAESAIAWFGLRCTHDLAAIHEGAHAVMAWHLGGHAHRINARPGAPSVFTGGTDGEAEAWVLLAAAAAEEVIYRVRHGYDAPDAWKINRHAGDYADALHILGSHPAVESCYAQVRQFVEEHWQAFDAAARWLVERPTPNLKQLALLRAHVARFLPSVAAKSTMRSVAQGQRTRLVAPSQSAH